MGLRLLALACLVGAAFAGPVQRQSENQCSKKCEQTPHPKFGWQAGKAYVYDLKLENFLTVAGNKKQVLDITATVVYHFHGSCEATLVVKDIRIKQDLPPEDIKALKEKIELHLSFAIDNNGTIQGLCPSALESVQSLNIKRAIISLLGNGMTSLEKSETKAEKDILGVCTTRFTVDRTENQLIITKEKDLKSCSHKSLFFYLIETKLKKVELLEKDLMECTQRIKKDRTMEESNCQEQRELKTPFENTDYLKFQAKVGIKYVRTEPAQKPSMQYTHSREDISHSVGEPRDGETRYHEKKAEQILEKLCKENKVFVSMTVGKDVVELASCVKNLPYDSLAKINRKLKDGSLCANTISQKVREMYYDVLPVAATDACFKLMVELMVNKEVTGIKYQLWPATFALRQHPTEETVAAIAPLLKYDSQSTSILLGVTTLIRRFCASEDCSRIPAVEEVVNIYKKNLRSDDEKKVLTSLRAYRSMGYVGGAISEVIECAKDQSKSVRVRMNAIEVSSLTKSGIQEIVKIYSNKEEDSQIRIYCLRSFFEHPDRKHLPQVKRVAERETDEQVSSYFSTYLQNVNRTYSPRHQKLRGMLQDIKVAPPKNNSTFDYLLNSKNIFVSAYNRELRVGGSFSADIIHGKTRTPLAFHTSAELNLFEKNIKALECGVLTEGMEDMVQKLLAVKDKIPKIDQIRARLAEEPTFEEFKEEFSYLSPKNVFGDTSAEVSMYIRALGIPVLDISTSDLPDMKEMLKVAELMSKLAHGQKVDFSHSVVLVSTKLTIASITGVTYSLDLVGTSTVGMTASTKADFMKLPRDADIHLHLQPSASIAIEASVGVSTTSGIASTHPVVKAVSRWHSRSDVEARFQVKDGHVLLASVSLPSENIASINMSTNIFEIDEDNHEKPIFGKMGKKMDYTFKHLARPLGVTAHATIEVPKPWVISKIPFLLPSVNAAIALKKSDRSLRSYEFRVEIPKHPGPSMKYRASFDTPGTKVSRRFAADVEVKQQRDKKDLMIELVSPFKSAGARCSFTKNDQLIELSTEVHSSGVTVATANITGELSGSKSRKICKVQGEYYVKDITSARMEGTVQLTKGRKEHLSFDFKTIKPETDPITLKGTIMKEGRIDLSPTSEWKLSSEISVSSPVGDVKLRKTVEKRSKQSHSISANVGVDYQLKGKEKHSIIMSGSSQRSSNKRNTQVKLELSEYPKANLHLTWDMQRESQENITNDLKLGQNPHKTYFHLKHKSRMPKRGPGHCSATIEFPQHDIHYDLSLDHEIDISEKPRINIEADLCYKQDKHIRGHVDLKYESVDPLDASGKIELQFPGDHHYIWEDKVKERNGTIEGHSRIQYRKGKVIHLNYRYKKLSDDSKLHHEIEGSIQHPSSRSPINGKASIEFNSESLAIVGQVGPDYSIQAHLKENGVNHIKVRLPMIEGFIKTTDEDEKKAIDLDVKVKVTPRPKHIIASVSVETGDKKTTKAILKVDDEVLFRTTVSRHPEDHFVSDTRVKILGYELSFAEAGDVSLLGDYECTVEAVTKDKKQFAGRFKRETGSQQGKLTLELTQNHEKKAVFELISKLNQNELSIGYSLTSPVHYFEDVHGNFVILTTRSGSNRNVKISISFQKKNQLYKTEWNSDIQPNGLEFKAEMQTPHKNYERNAVGFSIQVSDDVVSSSVSIDCSDNKKIYIQTEFKKTKHTCNLSCKIRTPFEIARDLQLQATLEHHQRKQHLKISIDSENKKVCDIEASLKKSSSEVILNGEVKVSHPKVNLESARLQYQSKPKHASLSANIQRRNNEVFTLDSEIKEEESLIYGVVNLGTPYEEVKTAKLYLSIENKHPTRNLLFYIDTNKQRKSDLEITIVHLPKGIEVKGRLKTARTPEMSTHVKYEKTEEKFSLSANVMKGSSPLLSTSFDRLSHEGGEKLLMKSNKLGEPLLNIEIAKDTTSRHSPKYSVKVDGPCSPVSITFQRNQNDKSSVSTELRMCSEVPSNNVCYIVKSYHKNLINTENYRFYQKVTMDMEKSVGGHFSKPIGKVHVLISATENDYRLKSLLEVNDKKIGHDSKLHLRQEERDRYTIDSHIYLLQVTSRVRVNLEQNHHRLLLEGTAIPNLDNPTSKLSLEVKKEINPDNKEVSGYIKMSHPRMSQPILITIKLEPVDDHFIKGRIVVHPSAAFRKTWVLEVKPNLEQANYGIRSLEYRIYNDGKSVDALLKFIRQSSRREDKVGFEWKYAKNGNEKEGKAMFILSDKKAGIPQTLKLKWITPSADYEVHGSVAQGPRDVFLSVTSRGRKVNEIRVSVADDCATIEVTKSGPLIKSQVCINKKEGHAYHLLKVDVQYRQHKCLTVRVGVNPDKPEYIDVVFKCNKDKSCRPLKELIHYLESLLKHHSLRELKQDIINKVTQDRQELIQKLRQHREVLLKKVEQLKQDTVEPLLRELRKSIRDLRNKLKQHEELINEYIRKLKEIKQSVLECILSAIPNPVKEICQKVYQDYRKIVIRYYQKVLQLFSNICEKRRYCTDVKESFRGFGITEIKAKIYGIFKKIKEALTFKWPEFRMIWPSDVLNFIKNGFKVVREKITELFGKLIGETIMGQLKSYAKKLETYVREKAIHTIDEILKKINSIFSQDEDLRTARDLILNAKNEIVNAWKNKEKIAETSARRMEDDLKRNLEKYIRVSKYDPDEGELSLSIRQPLSQDELESVKHELSLLFRKLRDYLLRQRDQQ